MERHVVTVNYNTPELCEAAIRSLNKQTPGCIVHLLDNSDSRPFTRAAEFANVDYIDNTHGQLVDFERWCKTFPNREYSENNYGSAKHCFSIALILHRLDTDCVVMDSDILLTRDIAPLYDERYVFQAEVKTNTKAWGFRVYRAKPILCYINVPLMRQLGITYFNGEKMWNLQNVKPQSKYDTGAWFYEQVERRKLPYNKIALADWCLHLRHASYQDRPATDWLNENKELWSD